MKYGNDKMKQAKANYKARMSGVKKGKKPPMKPVKRGKR